MSFSVGRGRTVPAYNAHAGPAARLKPTDYEITSTSNGFEQHHFGIDGTMDEQAPYSLETANRLLATALTSQPSAVPPVMSLVSKDQHTFSCMQTHALRLSHVQTQCRQGGVAVEMPLSGEALKALIHYLHTDVIPRTCRASTELLLFAAVSGDAHLLQTCEDVAISFVDDANFAELMRVARRHGMKRLEVATLRHLRHINERVGLPVTAEADDVSATCSTEQEEDVEKPETPADILTPVRSLYASKVSLQFIISSPAFSVVDTDSHVPRDLFAGLACLQISSNEVLLLCGRNREGDPSNVISCYTLDTSRINTIPIPSNFAARYGVACCRVDARVYVGGGRTSAKRAGVSNVSINDFGYFDKETAEWQALAPMLKARAVQHSLIAHTNTGYIFAIGGECRGINAISMPVERYDPERDEWTKVDCFAGVDMIREFETYSTTRIVTIEKGDLIWIFPYTCDKVYVYDPVSDTLVSRFAPVDLDNSEDTLAEIICIFLHAPTDTLYCYGIARKYSRTKWSDTKGPPPPLSCYLFNPLYKRWELCGELGIEMRALGILPLWD